MQIEGIRLIFEKYASGMGEKAVVNELTRFGRKDGAGNWNDLNVEVYI